MLIYNFSIIFLVFFLRLKKPDSPKQKKNTTAKEFFFLQTQWQKEKNTAAKDFCVYNHPKETVRENESDC